MQNQPRPDASAALEGLDEFVPAILKEWKGRGVALAIIKENEVIFARGFGERDEARHLPVTPQTLFPIASCTKAFTTAALGILADEGKLDWDTPVRAYIPSFRLHDTFASERVTPRDLCAHRTGLPRHDLAWYHNTTSSRQELFERLRYLEPTQDLRNRWQYQNLMYMTAGYLVEAISGQTWEAFVQERLFGPLEMPSSTFDVVQTSKEASDFSHPYREVGDEVKEIDFYAAQAAIAPAGAIVSNITELSHWVLMHLNRGVYQGKQILSEQQVNELHSPQMIIPPQSQYPEIPYASYGLGWVVDPYRGYPMVDHSGGIDGFRSLTTLFPREQIGIIVLSNLSQWNIPEILTYNVFERLMGLEETPWSERFMKERLAMKEAGKKGKEQSQQKRVEGTKPSHALEAYTGEFAHPGYGTLSISLKEGKLEGLSNGIRAITLTDRKLEGLFNGMRFPVRHYHYDIFEFAIEQWDVVMKVSFLTSVQGDIESVVAPFEPTGNDIVFQRVPEARMRETAFLEPFTGIYALLDLQVVIALKGEHTLSATVTGQPTYELEPYRGTEFRAKGISGVSIEFERDAAGAVTGALVTVPDGAFQLTKKG